MKGGEGEGESRKSSEGRAKEGGSPVSWTGLESQERSSDGLENLQLCSWTQQLQEGGQVQIIGASGPAPSALNL